MAGLVDFTKEDEVQEFLDNTEIEFMYGCHKENNEDSCYRLGEFLETIRKRFTEAAEIYKSCCESFQCATCCYKQGHYHMLGKGGLEKSSLKAFEAYLTSCKQENYADQGKNDRIAASCSNVGLLLMGDEDVQNSLLASNSFLSDNKEDDYLYSEILKSFKRACSLKDASGCNLLSYIYLSGFRGQHKDANLAAKFAEQACDLGEPKACHNLFIMHKRGDGVEKNAEKAESYAKRRDELVHGSVSLKFGQE